MTAAKLYRQDNHRLRRLGRVSLTQAQGALRYAPPAVTYTDLHINNAMLGEPDIREVVLSNGVDYNLIFDEVMPRRLRITGGRHVKIVGAEFNIASENIRPAFAVNEGDRYVNNCCLELGSQTGTFFIEGLWCHGAYASDSIRAPLGSGNTDIVIQNSRLDCDRIQTGIVDTTDGFIHTDGFQCWGGVRSLRMYNVTISNPYQGGMFGDGALAATWGPTVLDRVNYRPGLTTDQATKTVNFVGNADYMRGPFTIRDTYYQIGAAASWSTAFAPPMIPPYTGGAFYSATSIGTDEHGRQYGEPIVSQIVGLLGVSDGEGGPGRFYRGLPPAGDYVTGGGTGPGAGYISPGYAT